MASMGWRARRIPWSWLGIAAAVGTITAFHYLVDPHALQHHEVLRRLYYLPIIWAAFAGGLRLALLTAAATVAAYTPHAFFMPHHMDPASSVDKAAELLLYFAVGGLTGFLVDRERRAREATERAVVERSRAERDAARLEGLVHLTRGLAHEIRNPLAGIQGAIEILAGAVTPERPEREMADIGLRETQRLNRVLTQFLAFARPRPASPAAFEAGPLVQHVANLAQTRAVETGVEVTAGDDTARAQAFGDADHVTQVLLNLVNNAVAAAGPGGHVWITARRDDGGIRFCVDDDGPGIPPELEGSVYDPYVSGREDGTGLGLSIAALLVRQQGSLLAHSPRVEGGTSFHFQLPLPQEAS